MTNHECLTAMADRLYAARRANGRRLADHNQVTVTLGDTTAEVDEGVADLIYECWRAGLVTHVSCENKLTVDNGLDIGEPTGDVWIGFADEDSLQTFARVAGTKRGRLKLRWRLGAIRFVDEQGTPTLFSVLFPASDYTPAVRALRQYNRVRSGRCAA